MESIGEDDKTGFEEYCNRLFNYCVCCIWFLFSLSVCRTSPSNGDPSNRTRKPLPYGSNVIGSLSFRSLTPSQLFTLLHSIEVRFCSDRRFGVHCVHCIVVAIRNVSIQMTEEDAVKQGSPSFLDKLYTILEEESPHIISWNGEGDTFIIFSPDLFAQKVMSKYFKSTKFNSFIRQLNFYGFKKTTRDPSSEDKSPSNRFWEFRHPLFLRGRRDLLSKIHRKQLGDTDADVDSRFQQMQRDINYLYTLISEFNQWKVAPVRDLHCSWKCVLDSLVL